MRITRSLSSIDATVRKSLYDSVIRHVMALVQFPETANIIYDDDELRNTFQPGSTAGEKDKSVLGSERRITVSIEEMRNEHDRTARQVAGHLEDYIYRDPRYGVYIYPIPAAYDTTFTLQFRSHSKSEIKRVINSIMLRQDQGHTSFMTGGEFFYYIPKELFNIVVDVHNTAIDRDLALPSVDKYLLDNLADWVTIASDQATDQLQFTARHMLAGLQLIFDASEIKSDKSETYFSVNVTVTFTHERPVDIQADFPLYVTGNPMPDGYHPKSMSPWIVERDGFRNKLIEGADNVLEWESFQYPWLLTGEFVGEVGKNVSILLASDILPAPDENGDVCLLGLAELPVEFTESTMTYLRKMQAKNKHMDNSVIRIGYYINGTRVDSKNVYWDENLVLWTTVTPEVHKRHQIAVEVVTQLDTRDKSELDTMKEHPSFLWEYIAAFFPWILENKPRPTIPGHIDPTNPGLSPYNPPNPIYPNDPGSVTKPWETVDWDSIKDKVIVTTPVLDAVADATSQVPEVYRGSTGMKTIHVGTIIVKPKE